MTVRYLKFKRELIGFIVISFFSSCTKGEPVLSNNDIEDTRYKLVFSGPKEGFIIGDTSNKLIKYFQLQNDDYPPEYGGLYYFNELSKEVYMFGSKSNGLDLLYRFNIEEVLNTDGFNQTMQSQVIDTPPNERIIKGFVTKNGIVYTLNKVEISDPNYGDIYLRKIFNDRTEVVLKVSEILGFFPHFTDFYGEDIRFFRDTEELVFRTGAYMDTFFLSINLTNETFEPFNGNLHGKVFGTKAEYFMVEWEVKANDELFDVLFDQFDNKIGEIPVGIYTGQSRIFATYAYDPIDQRYEYIQKSDGVSQIGVLNTENFTFEVLSGTPSNFRSSISSIFYFSKE